MKNGGWSRNRWIFLLLAAMGALLFAVGGLLGGRAEAKNDYAGYLEDRARSLCLSIDGVKEAQVFLTLNEDTVVQAGRFKDTSAGSVPTVRGIAVVCTGGESPRIRETVTLLLSAALGIPTSRVSVAGLR